MPYAKLDEQASPEASEPLRQALIVVLRKIRNLEKRKRKIEQYHEEHKNGKTLNIDQMYAVTKFDEVCCTLENMHQILKHLNMIELEHIRLVRKDALERTQQDIAKIKEILIVQDVLQNMRQENVRGDFLAGQNGAVQITEDDLKLLDDLYLDISPKRGEDGLPPFEEQLQQCAEHLLSIVDGKAKDIVGTTYAKLKELIGTIQSCVYFEHTSEETTTELGVEGKADVQEAAEVTAEEEDAEVKEEDEVKTYVTQEQTTVMQPDTTVPKDLIPHQSVPAPMPVAVVGSSFFTTSAPVSEAFNSQPQLQPQYQPTPQPTSLNEFISSGGIDFMQASNGELSTAVDATLEADYRHIDTVYVYGNIATIKKTLKKWFDSGKIKREDLFIVTETIEAQVDVGKAHSFGGSNFNACQIKHTGKAARNPPDNLQVELHIYFQQGELVAFCIALDITVCAFAPIGSPGLSHFIDKIGGDKSSIPNLSPLSEPHVEEITQKHKKTPAQILLPQIMLPGIDAFPKSANPERIKQNFQRDGETEQRASPCCTAEREDPCPSSSIASLPASINVWGTEQWVSACCATDRDEPRPYTSTFNTVWCDEQPVAIQGFDAKDSLLPAAVEPCYSSLHEDLRELFNFDVMGS